MAVTDYRVRYGSTWYEHREGDEASPLTFRRGVETADGNTITWGNGVKSVIDPDDPDTTFHYLVDHLNQGRWPDQIAMLVDDQEPSGTVF